MDVYIERINEVFVRVHAEPSTLMEMSENFTFDVPGAQFSPAYKNKMWDGKIRLLHVMTGRIYYGLVPKIKAWAKSAGYSCDFDEDMIPIDNMTPEESDAFAQKIGCPFKPRDYQSIAVAHGVSQDRSVFLSPTASGKSLTIYLLARYHQSLGRKVLIIVPTVGLVSQMNGDFTEYNNDEELGCHVIKAGADKYVDADYTISTWQSIFKMKADFFDRFDVIIGDEAHTFKSKSLTSILEKAVNVKFRYGFTGTLDESKTNELVLQGLFGPVKRVASTDNLIEDGTLADFDIKSLVFEYTPEERKEVSKMSYQEEVSWIIAINTSQD